MVEGYVFDFGGVISVSPMPKWERTFFPYCRSIGLDPAVVLAGFRRYRRLWDGDLITFAEMYAKIFADAGLPPPTPEQLMFYDDFPENVEGARACGWQSELYPASIDPARWLAEAKNMI